MIKEATENVPEGISLESAIMSLITYADNKSVVESSQRELQSISKEHDIKINTKRQRSCVFSCLEPQS